VEILIIDGERGGERFLTDAVVQTGLSCRFVSGLAEAFKTARVSRPRAVIINTTMPASDMGPDHLLRMLRQTYPAIPLIVVSASANRQVAAIAAELQVPMLIAPVSPAQLRAALHECGVQSFSGMQQGTETAPPLSAAQRSQIQAR
jgi:CheY-like chemotaxis protein